MTTSPVCPQEHFSLYKFSCKASPLLRKDWATCYSPVSFTLLFFTFLSLIPRKPPKKLSFSACSYLLTKVTYYYLLLLIGFDAFTYRKHCNRSHYVMGHQNPKQQTTAFKSTLRKVKNPCKRGYK